MENSPPGAAPEILGPTIAGSWYPADRRVLEREIDRLLEAAENDSAGQGARPAAATPLAALIVPHAGYVYSGLVAAAGFRLLRGARVERVLLVGPSHYSAFDGAALTRAAAYRTPLGDVKIDTRAVSSLAAADHFHLDDGPFLPEHCLEIELPFLQRTLEPGFSLLPVLIGGASRPSSVHRVAEQLRPWFDDRTLMLVSSDFTHFGPRFDYVPFRDEVPRRIRELDLGAVHHILAVDGPGFDRYVQSTGATICGRRAIALLLRLCKSDWRGGLLSYDTSGRMTEDWSHSVSYASIGFPREVS